MHKTPIAGWGSVFSIVEGPGDSRDITYREAIIGLASGALRQCDKGGSVPKSQKRMRAGRDLGGRHSGQAPEWGASKRLAARLVVDHWPSGIITFTRPTTPLSRRTFMP
jgi:hypothetical protein